MATEAYRLEPDPVALVAAEVRAQMGRRGVRAARMGRDLGWSSSYLSRRLSGVLPFNIAELGQIARYLGCNLEDLIRSSRWIFDAPRLTSLDGWFEPELPFPVDRQLSVVSS